MSPSARRKRSRLTSGEDDDSVRIDAATSNLLSGTTSKRPRLTRLEHDSDSNLSDSPSHLSGSDSDGLMTSTEHVAALDNDTASPQTSSQTESHLDDEEMDDDEQDDEAEDEDLHELSDEAAMQKVQEEMTQRRRARNHAADNAIIEEITCHNFMCHTHLSIRVGPLINFIIGHNGSGKSAVLTALTICLGGKATATNRGQSLKAFIKEGKDSASLSVKIKNQGASAYKPDVYGKSIIVERHFSRQGSSGFKLRNAAGKIVCTKRDELNEILDFFVLQLDNPINVLTQDMARQFLNSSSAQEKYKFFHKGTQLETLDADYKETERTLDLNEDRLVSYKEQTDLRHEEYQEAREKSRKANSQQRLVEAMEDCRRKMAWAQVEHQERLLVSVKNDIGELETNKQERQVELGEATAALERQELELEAAKARVEERRAERVPLSEKVDELKHEHNTAKSQRIEAHGEERQINSELRAADAEVKNLEKQIEEEERKLRDANDGRAAEIHTSIQDRKNELEELRTKHSDANSELPALNEVIKTSDATLRSKRTAVDDFKRQMDVSRGKITRLENTDGRRTMDQSLAQLLRAIRNETRWREQPVGPFWKHIYLKEPGWKSVLEKQHGNMLDSFAVTCVQDQQLLSDLMRRVKYNGRVVIGSKQRIDTSRNEPDENFMTWARVLRIDNDLVWNTLVIHQAIEQTVLMDRRDEASKFISNNPRAPSIKQIFALADTRAHGGHRMSWSATGGLTLSPIHPYRGPDRLQTDVRAELDFERTALEDVRQEWNAAKQRTQEAEAAVGQAKKDYVEKKREVQNLKYQMDTMEDQISQLQSELEAATPQTGVIESLQADLDAAKERRQEVELTNQIREVQAELEEYDTRVKKAEKHVQDCDNKRHHAVLGKNETTSKLESLERRLEVVHERLDEQQATVDTFTEQATIISPRVRVGRGETEESLELKHGKLEQELEKVRQEMGGSREELLRQELEAKEAWEKTKSQMEELEELARSLKSSLFERQERFRKFQDLIVMRAKTQFSYMLAERQFRGTLIVSHVTKTLEINVEPDITKKNEKGRNTKTLSGGEKSFSTICLLLALWEAMGSPIRCLDEFDVFMDSVNRDIAMKMMVGAARLAVSRQFILITPQSMANVSLGEDVKIHKMNDPERNQTTLPFARVAASQA